MVTRRGATPSGDRCGTCPLVGVNHGFLPLNAGEMEDGILLVAESLGRDDAVLTRALVGDAGFLMGRAFSRKKWKREEFGYATVMRCHSPFPIRNEVGAISDRISAGIAHCAPYLDRELTARNPKVIVALGEIALERLTGVAAPAKQTRGYVFRDLTDRFWVVSTFHPEFLMRGNLGQIHAFIRDMEKAKRIALEGYRYDTLTCLMDPGVSAWQRYLEDYAVALDLNPQLMLAADIETPWTGRLEEDEFGDVIDPSYTIERVSFAFEESRGVSVPYRTPYIEGIQELLGSNGEKCFWNRPFDQPRLVANGHRFGHGDVLDTMDKWHVAYNALPRALGYATSFLQHGLKMWKHLSKTEPEYYSTVDAIALWRNNRDIDEILTATGAMGVYDLICRELDPVLRKMEKAGMLVDLNLRARIEQELEDQLASIEARIEAVVPEAVKQIEIRKTRKSVEHLAPEFVVEVPGTKVESTCLACGAHPVTADHVNRQHLKVSRGKSENSKVGGEVRAGDEGADQPLLRGLARET